MSLVTSMPPCRLLLIQVSYAVFQAAEEAAATGPRGKKRTAADAVVANADKAVVDLSSPIVAAKAVKNDAELAGMREAHLRDSVAICDFLNWIEQKVRGPVLHC